MTDALIINRDCLSNFHTHTTYCDGADSPQALAETAYSSGFSALGFSGHAWSYPDRTYAMDEENLAGYIYDVNLLKAEYRGKMEVYLGIERDYYSPHGAEVYDYIIGSVHNVERNGEFYSVDNSPELFAEAISAFGGAECFVRAYYETEAGVLERTEGQIVGHFDLVTKFNGRVGFFDEDDSIYRSIAIESARRICESYERSKAWKKLPEGLPDIMRQAIMLTHKPIFELNTGAIARGWRDLCYPASFIIRELKAMGAPMILSSDCHDRRRLTQSFKDAIENAASA